MLFGNSSTQVIIPAIADKPPYDPVKDFQAVYIMAISPTSIVVHESVPARTLKEFIDYARANPTKLSYGSAGAGTMTNLSGELFKELIGVQGHHPHSLQRLGAGRGRSRLRPHPDDDAERRRTAAAIPCARQGPHPRGRREQAARRPRPTSRPPIEAGLPGMVAANFNGLFAPAGVPKDIINALADETRAAMADPQVQKLMIKSGFEPVLDSGPEAAQQEVASEYARWTPIIKKLGFKVQ